MKTDAACALFLRDLGPLLTDLAIDARKRKEAAKGSEEYDIELGRLMGLYEVVSLMQQQADAFGLSRDLLGLDSIEPETHLL